jgi:hypothetical protein
MPLPLLHAGRFFDRANFVAVFIIRGFAALRPRPHTFGALLTTTTYGICYRVAGAGTDAKSVGPTGSPGMRLWQIARAMEQRPGHLLG